MWGNEGPDRLDALCVAWRTTMIACALFLLALGVSRIDPERLAKSVVFASGPEVSSPTPPVADAESVGWGGFLSRMYFARARADTLL